MKVLTVLGPGRAEYSRVPAPAPAGDMIKIKVLRTGICATDFAIYTGDCSFVRDGQIKYPVRFGHEYSGVVAEVGERVTKFKAGDRVYSDNAVSCGVCPACRAGKYADCPEIRSVGTVNAWDGCYAEYMYMPERHVYPIPDALGFDAAALIEPASIALDAFTGVTLSEEDTAVVIGTGAIGMSSAYLAKHFGAGRVILVGRSEAKLAVARRIGADAVINSRETDPVAAILDATGGTGANLLIETSGDRTALNQTFLAAARYGRISALSFYEQELDGMPIDRIVLGCLTLRGAAGSFGAPRRVAEIMAGSATDLTAIITHRVKFDDCLEFFRRESQYHSAKIKAMVEFD